MARSRFGVLEIGGFPTKDVRFAEAGVELVVYGVDGLEDRVDREALLRADDPPEPPYWAHLWVGARALARELAAVDLRGRRVLDLGCGLGLPGLVAAHRGGEVWLVDRERVALDFVAASAERNDLRVHVRALDFTTDSLDVRFDDVLGAEIVYEPSAYQPLAAFVDRHLARGGRLHMTDAFRSDATRFFDELARRGFHGERRAVREWEDGRWQGLFLWTFRR
jgi:predicted nicotinamide N-methyase